MPKKPRQHLTKGSPIRTLKSRVDAHRYGSEWQRLRGEILAADPVCTCDRVRYWNQTTESYGTMDCCGEPGRIAPAVLVDHVRPLSMGGDHDWDNLQSLCGSCHAKKTQRWG